MTHAEAYRRMYGSASQMKTVLQQRRAIAQEALATLERLRMKLEEGFPPVDSVGADLALMLEANLSRLKRQIEEIEKAIAACELKATARTTRRARPAQTLRQQTRRKR